MERNETFLSKMIDSFGLTTFKHRDQILAANGFEVDYCDTEEEARAKAASGFDHKWPCYFFQSDAKVKSPLKNFYAK